MPKATLHACQGNCRLMGSEGSPFLAKSHKVSSVWSPSPPASFPLNPGALRAEFCRTFAMISLAWGAVPPLAPAAVWQLPPRAGQDGLLVQSRVENFASSLQPCSHKSGAWRIICKTELEREMWVVYSPDTRVPTSKSVRDTVPQRGGSGLICCSLAGLCSVNSCLSLLLVTWGPLRSPPRQCLQAPGQH